MKLTLAYAAASAFLFLTAPAPAEPPPATTVLFHGTDPAVGSRLMFTVVEADDAT